MPSVSSQPRTMEPATGAGSRYKWIALSNTTLGMLMATVNSSIMLIALPDIFRGIGVDPLRRSSTAWTSRSTSPSRRAWSRRWRRYCAAAGTCTRSTARPWSRHWMTTARNVSRTQSAG